MIDKFGMDKTELPQKRQELQKCKADLKSLHMETTYADVRRRLKIEDRIAALRDELETIESGGSEGVYFYNTADILLEYYDEEQNECGMSLGEKTKKTGIHGFFDDSSDNVSRTQINNKGNLLDKYLVEVESGYTARSDRVVKVNMCKNCNTEMLISSSDGLMVCVRCGSAVHIVVESTKPCYKEPIPENSYFAYKRINHFKEWLSQFQAKESTTIPQDVYDHVLIEIKKAQIQNLATLKPATIRGFLKKLRMNKYYEHTAQIINKLNHIPPPVINRDIEEKLCSMFMEIQEPFEECAPVNRKNFLSYSYVLHKMTEIIGLVEFSNCFSLLKSREKLKQQDRIWCCICAKLNWPYHGSI